MALHALLFLCGISGLLTGVWSVATVPVPCCPSGWTRLQDRCFIYQAPLLSYAAAEAACNVLGGNLAAIRDSVENDLAFQLVRNGNGGNIQDTWIGIHDGITEGNFLGIDGVKSKFLNFRANQPDDFGGDEDCAEIDDEGQWNDETCTDTNHYICAINLW